MNKILKDICVSITDCPHSTPIWTENGKIVIRNTNIKHGKLDLSSPSYTNDEQYQMRIARANPVAGDLIITREAPMGDVCIVPPEIECCLGQRMVLLKPDYDLCDNHFLLYALLSPDVQHQISWRQGTGTTVSNLRIPDLEALQIPYFEISTQLKISGALKSIDDKIDANVTHINILSEIIGIIFENWFNNFNYPDATGEMQDGIPIGWANCNVFDNVTEVREKNKDSFDYPVLSVVKEGEFKPSDDFFVRQVYSKETTNYKIVRRNQVGYNPARANIGSIAMLIDFDIGLVSPIYVVFAMEKTITPTFFHYYMKQPAFIEGIKRHAIGTTRQNFPFEAFKMFPMVVPPMELQKRFEEIAQPIERKILKLKEENVVLAEIRDTILPKLMSGELPLKVGED